MGCFQDFAVKGVKEDCSGILPEFKEEIDRKIDRWFTQQEDRCDAMSMELESGSDLDKSETQQLDDGSSAYSTNQNKLESPMRPQEEGVSHSSSDDESGFTGSSNSDKRLTLSSQGRTHHPGSCKSIRDLEDGATSEDSDVAYDSQPEDCDTLKDQVLTMGPFQRLQKPYTGPESTLIRASAFEQYLKDPKTPLSVVKAWNHFEKYRKRNKMRYSSKEIMIDERLSVRAVGPFRVPIALGPCIMVVNAYVTRDSRFKRPMWLGRQCWAAFDFEFSYVNAVTSHQVTEGAICRVDERFRALIDSGAEPNLITASALRKIQPNAIKHEVKQLYRAANNQLLPIKFCVKDLSIHIEGHLCKIDALVVDSLGREDLILGREFILKYHVIIDLPKHEIIIMDADAKSKFLQRFVEDERSSQEYLASAAKECGIDAHQISSIPYKVRSKERKTSGKEQVMEDGSWLAVVKRNAGKDLLRRHIATPNAVLKVTNHRTSIPLMNILEPYTKVERDAHEEEYGQGHSISQVSTRIKPTKSELKIRPVRVEYVQQSQDENDPEGLEPSPMVIMKVASDGRIYALHVNNKDEAGSDFLTDAHSTIPGQQLDVKPFQTRPNVEKCKELLSKGQHDRLQEILSSNDDLFSKNKNDIGLTDLLCHTIELKEGSQPFKTNARRLNPEKREAVTETIKGMADCGMIVDSRSPFASGIVMVSKKDGTYRMCIDFRQLNEMTIKDAYPLPRIDETVESMGSARYYSSLDMGSAFWQVPLSEESKKYTAFACHDGLFQCERMPFGLCNATATFQRLMARALSPIMNKYGNLVLCYIDDILIATKTIDEHLDRLQEVFTCLRKAGLKLKASKCVLFETEIVFLGRRISHGEVRPDPERVARVKDWHPPRNKSELVSFLGFASYYREFIPRYAHRAHALTVMVGEKVPFEWKELHQDVFDEIRNILLSEPMVALPTDDGEFILDTDASKVALGAVLSQIQKLPNGQTKEVVIQYGSKSLTRTQRNYSPAKLEMLAALLFMEKYANFLLGRVFTLRVDSRALLWIMSAALTNNSLSHRWINRMQDFRFSIEHRKREKHFNADAMTKITNVYEETDVDADKILPINFQFLVGPWRQECEDLMLKVLEAIGRDTADLKREMRRIKKEDKKVMPSEDNLIRMIRLDPTYSAEQLAREQREDVCLSVLRTLLSGDKPGRDAIKKATKPLSPGQQRWIKKHFENLRINSDGVIVKKSRDSIGRVYYQIVPPPRKYTEIIRAAHDDQGHFGAPQVTNLVLRKFDWPGVMCDIQQHVSSCPKCQRGKELPIKPVLHNQPIKSTEPNELVMLDHCTMWESKEGYKGVLMMIDHFTKWCVAVPVKDYTSEETARAFFKHWICPIGIPKIVHTDRGTAFEGKAFQEMSRFVEFIKSAPTPHRPTTQGAVERLNRTIAKVLRIISPKQESWPDFLDEACWAYNNCVHSTTRISPYEARTGQKPFIPVTMLFKDYYPPSEQKDIPYMKEHLYKMHEVHALMRKFTNAAQERQSRQHDKRVKNSVPHKCGQRVMAFVHAQRGKARKLQKRYCGPFVVTRILRNGVLYELDNKFKMHFEHLRPYVHRFHEAYVDDHGEFTYFFNGLDKPILDIEPDPSPYEEDRASEKGENQKWTGPDQHKHHDLRRNRKILDYDETSDLEDDVRVQMGNNFILQNEGELEEEELESLREEQPPADFLDRRQRILNENIVCDKESMTRRESQEEGVPPPSDVTPHSESCQLEEKRKSEILSRKPVINLKRIKIPDKVLPKGRLDRAPRRSVQVLGISVDIDSEDSLSDSDFSDVSEKSENLESHHEVKEPVQQFWKSKATLKTIPGGVYSWRKRLRRSRKRSGDLFCLRRGGERRYALQLSRSVKKFQELSLNSESNVTESNAMKADREVSQTEITATQASTANLQCSLQESNTEITETGTVAQRSGSDGGMGHPAIVFPKVSIGRLPMENTESEIDMYADTETRKSVSQRDVIDGTETSEDEAEIEESFHQVYAISMRERQVVNNIVYDPDVDPFQTKGLLCFDVPMNQSMPRKTVRSQLCNLYPEILKRLWEGHFGTGRTVHLKSEDLEDSILHEAVVFQCRISWSQMCTEVGYGMFLAEAKEKIVASGARRVIMLPPPVKTWRFPISTFLGHLASLFKNTDILVVVTAKD